MHAYLFTGTKISDIRPHVLDLSKRLHAKVMEFPLQKIGDVRSLNNLIRLSFDEPTLIISQNIHEATEEALNAFLKNLEEPQDNIYFVLTAPSERKVLPTIVSRCQVIKITNHKLQITNKGASEIKNFISMTQGEKFSYIDKIKDRVKAGEFAESLVNYYHDLLHKRSARELKTIAQNAESAMLTLNKIKSNGNVSLSLTNLVISLTETGK